jgi:hypothetical protein
MNPYYNFSLSSQLSVYILGKTVDLQCQSRENGDIFKDRIILLEGYPLILNRMIFIILRYSNLDLGYYFLLLYKYR